MLNDFEGILAALTLLTFMPALLGLIIGSIRGTKGVKGISLYLKLLIILGSYSAFALMLRSFGG
jgi:hypothetical protein